MQFVVSAVFAMLTVGIWYAGWAIDRYRGFPIAIVLSAPLIALAVLPLIAALSSKALRLATQIAYRDIEGKHYEYKGRSIRVHEDLTGDRWLRIQDIRKILPNLPKDEVWAKIAPDDLGRIETKKEVFLSAQALDQYLARNQDDLAVRFRNWLEREIIFPVKKARELGLARNATREHAPPTAP